MTERYTLSCFYKTKFYFIDSHMSTCLLFLSILVLLLLLVFLTFKVQRWRHFLPKIVLPSSLSRYKGDDIFYPRSSSHPHFQGTKVTTSFTQDCPPILTFKVQWGRHFPPNIFISFLTFKVQRWRHLLPRIILPSSLSRFSGDDIFHLIFSSSSSLSRYKGDDIYYPRLSSHPHFQGTVGTTFST